MEKTQNITVIGGGTMGGGIVQVFAQHGFNVTLVEMSAVQGQAAISKIAARLDRLVAKEKLTPAERDHALGAITLSISIPEGVSQADLVVEAVPEVMELKRKVLQEADHAAPAEAILASNTSSISITALAALTQRPERFIGMHFFNPVPVMKLVEVVRGLQTDADVVERISALSLALGKVPVTVNDSPGFVSNRVLMPMINEAVFCVYEGVGTPEQVDEVMKLGMAHPMGPLRLADFIGLDVCLDILNVLYEGFRDPKYRPCPLLRTMVSAGRLGDKTGRGFYEHG